MTHEVEHLLTRWEQTYKRGLLSFWILLLLEQREMYPYEMSNEIVTISHGSISADNNSIYRALKRFSNAGLVQSRKEPSATGPARRYFTLTDKGGELLALFIRRNLLPFCLPELSDRMNRIVMQYQPTKQQ